MEQERTNFQDLSQFKFYSLGIAVENIDPEDEEKGLLKISPVEKLNAQKPGFIHNFKDIYTNIHPDEREKIVNDSITSRNYLIAEWSPYFNPNRVTPPTVYKNETVMIFKFGNVGKFFWTSLKHEPHIRRLEKARYAWSNINSDEPGFTPYNKETSYWFEVDTINKKITLKTNDNDGESAKYEIVIDTKEGTIEAKDNHDNKLKWESEQGTLMLDFKERITLKAGVEIVLDAPTVRITGALLTGGNIFSGGEIFGERIRSSVIDGLTGL